MKVGFIGLGNMGAAMAANLVKAGHEVLVFNRTPAKADPLVALGATRAATIAEASRGDAVITMLSNDEAVAETVLGAGGVAASLSAGALHISASTISVALCDKLAEAHGAVGQLFVAAPVFGRPDAAAAGKLFVVAAGADAALARATPLFEAVGQRTFPMGAAPSQASLAKITGNFLIANVIEGLGEALALVGKGGIDPGAYLDFLTSTLFNAPIYKTYGGLILAGDSNEVGFAAPLGLKDVKLALAAGDQLKVPLPVASLLRDRFLALLAQGGEGLDWSAIGRLPAKDAGLATR